MRASRPLVVSGLVLAAALAAVAAWTRQAGARDRRAAAEAAAAELAVHEADIAFFEHRASADPRGAADRLHLAALYVGHARETGAADDWLRAEALARASLALRTGHNTAAAAVLASALMAQHRFTDALAVARALVDAEPWSLAHRSLLGEVQLELGDYAAARTTFDSLAHAAADPAVTPRWARWQELTGHTDAARQWLRTGLAGARRMRHLTREQLAWYYLRLGDFELRHDRWQPAETALRDGLAVAPGDYRLLAAMARLAAARGRWRDAIRYGDDALGVAFEPGTLGVLGDAWAALGDTAKAVQHVRAMELAISGQSGPLHRQWSLYLLDHGRDVDLIYRKAREELASRKDIYGYDLVAWAALKAGRRAEARVAMNAALALGTDDPLLRRHAAAIAAAQAGGR